MRIGNRQIDLVAAVGNIIGVLRVHCTGEVARLQLPQPLYDRLTAEASIRAVREVNQPRRIACLLKAECRGRGVLYLKGLKRGVLAAVLIRYDQLHIIGAHRGKHMLWMLKGARATIVKVPLPGSDRCTARGGKVRELRGVVQARF